MLLIVKMTLSQQVDSKRPGTRVPFILTTSASTVPRQANSSL